MSALLHAHQDGNFISEFLHNTLGDVGCFIDEVLIHGIGEALMLRPFWVLTYLRLEFIEHNASDKTRLLLSRAGGFGPLFASLGALPQCGFSAAAASLYAGRVISMGTLVAVFLATSDEMLPILIAGEVELGRVAIILVYKVGVAILAGFLIDLVIRLFGLGKKEIDIDAICEEDGCNCKDGIFKSAVHHTVSVFLSCLAVIIGLNALVFFIGEDNIGRVIVDIPILSHLICSLVGLIPNCAASVVLARLAVGGFITVGEMLAGLFSAAGVGIFVLFRMNKSVKENFAVLALVIALGVVFGFVADLLPFITI